MKRTIIFCLMLLLISGNLISKETNEESFMKLKIVGFGENSSLEKAGAKINDIFLNYNGKPVHNLNELNKLKEENKDEKVKVGILRGQAVITLEIPKGRLGAYLNEVVTKHPIDKDAVIIDGIGELKWGAGMENSFFGALSLVENKIGQHTSYNDLVGLSGYGFRLHFFKGFCPSSPDATIGKNVGTEIMKKLGYKVESYFLYKDEWKNEDVTMKPESELRKAITESIDKGFPVIALDLIEVPEWGLITGYQKDGKEFFCRTYFDKVEEGYEIGKKFPWMIIIIKDYQKADISPLFNEVFEVAKELYNTEKYDKYYSGIRAIKEWIADLNDEKLYECDENALEEKRLANWWIFYSLSEARNVAADFLERNMSRFDKDPKLIKELSEIYKKETTLLRGHESQIPCPYINNPDLIWNKENRQNQIKVLNEFLELENQADEILKKI